MHRLVWQAAKAAGDAKKTMDIDAAEQLADFVEQAAVVFWSTEEAEGSGLYPATDR